MAKWTRTNEFKPAEMRVTIIARKDTDPDLMEWLSSIPYGKSNQTIKAILLKAINDGVADSFVSREPSTVPQSVTDPKASIINAEESVVSQKQPTLMNDSVASEEPEIAPAIDEESSFTDEELMAMQAMQNRF